MLRFASSSSSIVIVLKLQLARTCTTLNTRFSTCSKYLPVGCRKEPGMNRYSSSCGNCEKSRIRAPWSTDPTTISTIIGIGLSQPTPEYLIATSFSLVVLRKPYSVVPWRLRFFCLSW